MWKFATNFLLALRNWCSISRTARRLRLCDRSQNPPGAAAVVSPPHQPDVAWWLVEFRSRTRRLRRDRDELDVVGEQPVGQ